MLYTMNLQTAQKFLSFNKIMKAGMLVWVSHLQTVVGFSSDNLQTHVMKVLNKQLLLDEPVPNFAIMTKDLTALVKAAEKVEESHIYLNLDMQHNPNIYAYEMYTGGVIKPCYDFLELFFTYKNSVEEWNASKTKDIVSGIENIGAFEPLLKAKASDGIITVRYNGITYFIPAMMVNMLKKDSAMVEVRKSPGTIYNYVRFCIFKSKGVEEDIFYKMMDV